MADSNELTADGAAPGADAAARKEARRTVLGKIARAVPTFIELVRSPDGKSRTLVIERLHRTPAINDEQAAEAVREALSTAGLQHANVVRARAVSVRADEIVVASDYVEGERLSELSRAAAGPGVLLEII